jgi:hypothetical protein
MPPGRLRAPDARNGTVEDATALAREQSRQTAEAPPGKARAVVVVTGVPHSASCEPSGTAWATSATRARNRVMRRR